MVSLNVVSALPARPVSVCPADDAAHGAKRVKVNRVRDDLQMSGFAPPQNKSASESAVCHSPKSAVFGCRLDVMAALAQWLPVGAVPEQ
jgi:hypothetical protein